MSFALQYLIFDVQATHQDTSLTQSKAASLCAINISLKDLANDIPMCIPTEIMETFANTTSSTTSGLRLTAVTIATKVTVSNGISATANATVSFVIQVILCVLIIISNIIAIVICTREGYETVRAKVNDIVLSLAVADLCVGLALPFHASFFEDPTMTKNRAACFLRVSVTLQHVMASVLNLLLVTIDRYVAILHPYVYYSKGSLPQARLLIVLVWSYSVFVCSVVCYWNKGARLQCALADIVTPEFYAAFWAAPFFLVTTTIILLYARIFLVAFKQEQRLIKDVSFQQPGAHHKIRDFKYAKVSIIVARLV